MTTHPLGTVAHFAVNAEDVDASRRFYADVFGWRFEPWGPPSFFHVLRADGEPPGPVGALQGRRTLDGVVPVGFECTVAVADPEACAAAALRAGGRVLMERTTIAGVGDLVWLADPSGNPVGAMRYDPTAS